MVRSVASLKEVFVAFKRLANLTVPSLAVVAAVESRSSDFQACPQYLSEWSEFRVERTNDLLRSFSAREATIALKRYKTCLANPDITHANRKKISRCMERYAKYAEAIIVLDPTNKEQPVLVPDDPQITNLPEAFLSSSLRNGIKDVYSDSMKKFAALIAKKFPKSDFLIHLDEFINANTVIIRMRGESYERYYHITEKKFEMLAIIVEKKGEGGREYRPARIYFRRYNLPEYEGHQPPAAVQTEAHCYQCHASGPIGVLNTSHNSIRVLNSSHDMPLLRFSDQAEVFNASLEQDSYVVLKGFGRFYRDLGPGIGPSSSELRTTEFIKQCSARHLSANSDGYEKSVEAVKNGMDCASCHDNENMASLNIRSERFAKLIEAAIGSGHMPAYSFLNENERRGLYDCLMKEYFSGTVREDKSVGPSGKVGIVAHFLFEPSCYDKSAAKKAKGRDRSRFKRWDK